MTLSFSGEAIYQAGEDGPYELQLDAVGEVEGDAAIARFTSPPYRHDEFGEIGATIDAASDNAVDEDGDGRLDFLETRFRITVRVAGEYTLAASLGREETLASAYTSSALAKGVQTLALRFSGVPLRRSARDGPYGVTAELLNDSGSGSGGWGFDHETRAYRSSSFAAVLEQVGAPRDEGIDRDGDGQFELLRVVFDARLSRGGRYVIGGRLVPQGSPNCVFAEEDGAETAPAWAAGQRVVTLDFDGRRIRELGARGPFGVEVVVRDAESYEEVDRFKLEGRTAAYRASDFGTFGEPEGRGIRLTGRAQDRGVDRDRDGRFEALRIDIEVELDQADEYSWSGYLIDSEEAQIATAHHRGRLAPGKRNVSLVFDGEAIVRHGVDGPYRVKGFAMYGMQGFARDRNSGPVTGPNVPLEDVATTRAYAVTQLQPPSPPASETSSAETSRTVPP